MTLKAKRNRRKISDFINERNEPTAASFNLTSPSFYFSLVLLRSDAILITRASLIEANEVAARN